MRKRMKVKQEPHTIGQKEIELVRKNNKNHAKDESVIPDTSSDRDMRN